MAGHRNDDYTNRNVNLTNTHLFSPTLINESRVGLVRVVFPAIAESVGGGWPQKLGLPDNVPGLALPSASITGYRTFPTYASSQAIHMYVLQFQNNLTWIRGKHALKAGLDIRKSEFDRSITSYSSGLFNFNSTVTSNLQAPAGTGSALASFLLGTVANASVESDHQRERRLAVVAGGELVQRLHRNGNHAARRPRGHLGAAGAGIRRSRLGRTGAPRAASAARAARRSTRPGTASTAPAGPPGPRPGGP